MMDCRTLDLLVFVVCRVVLICPELVFFPLSLMVVWWYNKTGSSLLSVLGCKYLFFALEDTNWRVGKSVFVGRGAC